MSVLLLLGLRGKIFAICPTVMAICDFFPSLQIMSDSASNMLCVVAGGFGKASASEEIWQMPLGLCARLFTLGCHAPADGQDAHGSDALACAASIQGMADGADAEAAAAGGYSGCWA